jgi:hypothetical protein
VRGSSSEAKMKYLSLALFAQRTTRGLIAFKRGGDKELIRKSLEDAIASLTQATTGTSTVRMFTNYEQVSTLQDINQPTEEIVGVLAAMLEGKDPQDVDKAIRFFHDLEKQALINCERPEEQIPSGIRQLWQPTT